MSAEAKELLAALEPFARFAEDGFVGSVYEGARDERLVLVRDEGRPSQVGVTVGDFRRAYAAIAKARGEG